MLLVGRAACPALRRYPRAGLGKWRSGSSAASPANYQRAPRRKIRYPIAVNNSRLPVNLALIGFMGTGKSSVGRLVAEQLHFDYLDTDELIQSRAGRTITDIFDADGEASFRKLEHQLVNELAARKRTVISTGGGLPANPDNLTSLKTHALVVCLWASPEKIWDRVRNQTHRPLLRDPNPQSKIRELLAAREPFYRQADVLINTDLRSTREVAQQIVHHFKFAQSRQ